MDFSCNITDQYIKKNAEYEGTLDEKFISADGTLLVSAPEFSTEMQTALNLSGKEIYACQVD